MPTYAWLATFSDDWKRLTDMQQKAFLLAVTYFVADLKSGVGFRKGLRVKKMRGHDGVWEMTWADDGRATFEYGPEEVPGEANIVWRRIGTHGIFKRP